MKSLSFSFFILKESTCCNVEKMSRLSVDGRADGLDYVENVSFILSSSELTALIRSERARGMTSEFHVLC